MMHGNGWSGFNGCGLGLGSGYFSIWHYLIMIGIVLIILALVTIRKSKSSSTSDAVEKLKILFVSGEITEEEYMKRKNVIERK
jgi:putative membrane protein